MKLVVLHGTTNSGKSSQGKLLAQMMQGLLISSGAIATALMDNQTRHAYSKGLLSPHGDQITERVGRTLLQNPTGLTFLDGFPRTIEQMEQLDAWHDLYFPKFKMLMIHLNVPFNIILDRAKERSRDAFDAEKMVRLKHETYLKETAPVFEKLSRKNWTRLMVHVPSEVPSISVNRCLSKMVRAYITGQLDML